MSKSKIEKRADNTQHILDTIQKAMFSFIPGGAVLEGFLHFRTSLKQKRIFEFVESLKNAIEGCSEETLDLSNFTTEEFVDLFDSIIFKVQSTKSDKKLARFKNILANQIFDPGENDLVMKYVHILDQLNDIQIIILDDIAQLGIQDNTTYFNSTSTYPVGATAQSFLSKCEGINKEEIEFYLNQLASNGLIVAKQPNNNQTSSLSAFSVKNRLSSKYYVMTKIGQDFLDLIKDHNSQ